MNCLIFIFLFVWSEALCMGGVKENKKLLETLFADYNKDIRPSHDYSRPINIQVKMYIMSVLGLDIKNQVLSFKGFFQFTWKDELLTWKPQEHGGIKEIILPDNKVWTPAMTFHNSIDGNGYIGDDDFQIVISSDGGVDWQPGFRFNGICKVDISRYPFDENSCPVSIGPWVDDNSSMKLLYKSEGSIDFNLMNTNGQFEIAPGEVTRTVDSFEEVFYEITNFPIVLKRRPAHIAMSLLMPVAMLGVLSAMSFLLSPEEPEKVTVSITVLLSFTVFLGVIDNDLPETSDNMSYLAVYVSTLQVLAFLSVAGNVLVLIVNRRENEREKLRLSSKTLDTQSVTTTCQSETVSQALQNLLDLDPIVLLEHLDLPAQSNPQPQTDLSPLHQPKLNFQVSGEVKKQPVRRTRAYSLNKCFFAANCTALVVSSCVIGTLISF